VDCTRFLLQVLHIDFVAFNKPSTSTDGAAKRGHSGNIADGSNNDAKKLSDHAWHKNGQVRIGRFKLIVRDLLVGDDFSNLFLFRELVLLNEDSKIISVPENVKML